MQRFSTSEALVAHRTQLRRNGLRIGFVPTMGALHAGHLSLVRAARARVDVVVASIFVNPKQFGPGEDFERYPRDLDNDAHRLAAEGCDVLFAPEASAFYPVGFQTEVRVGDVTQGLCGASRPGHFDGVTTVVAKLFHLVAPDVAVFGEKDYQQLTVIRRMVRDLAFDVEIVGAPIVREADGLAMSSRNAYLSSDERERALSLSRGLFAARAAFAAGVTDPAEVVAKARTELDAAGVEPEYLELRGADLRPVDRAGASSVLLVAARVGATRLIDNVVLGA